MAHAQITPLVRSLVLRRCVPRLLPACSPACGLKTSPTKQDITPQLPEPRIPSFDKPILPDLSEEQKKNWISYGWSLESKEEDRMGMHSYFFAWFTIFCVGAGFFAAYGPDYQLKDWAQREAYLELRRREKLGLPLISKDFIDPQYLVIPSDEELGDTEIII